MGAYSIQFANHIEFVAAGRQGRTEDGREGTGGEGREQGDGARKQ